MKTQRIALVIGVCAAVALGTAAPANADGPWVAAAFSPSTSDVEYAHGSAPLTEVQASAMSGCGQRHVDCTPAGSSPECMEVATDTDTGRWDTGYGPSREAAAQDLNQRLGLIPGTIPPERAHCAWDPVP
jgi:hypothetical protein